jgi:hypothetical protein
MVIVDEGKEKDREAILITDYVADDIRLVVSPSAPLRGMFDRLVLIIQVT